MDKETASGDVKGKREAARRWANHVNKSAKVKVKAKWSYLLGFRGGREAGCRELGGTQEARKLALRARGSPGC